MYLIRSLHVIIWELAGGTEKDLLYSPCLLQRSEADIDGVLGMPIARVVLASGPVAY